MRRIRAIILGLAAVGLLMGCDDTDELNRQIGRLDQKLNDAEKKLEAAREELDAAAVQLETARAKELEDARFKKTSKESRASGGFSEAASVARAQEDEGRAKEFFKLFPVGTVEKRAGTTRLKIADKYGKALKGLDGFSHVVVLYWFDKNDTPAKRSILQSSINRFPNKPFVGVFASRAPVRPNLIALSVCRILSVEGNTVRVAGIDAFDGTPILDLKPHVPMIDSPRDAKVPDWWQPGGPGGQGQGGQGSGGQGPGGPGGASGGEFVEWVMGFDKNGDGRVTKDEMPERMKDRLLKRADTNGDGAVDKQEVKKHAEKMGQGGGGQGRGRR